MLDRQVFAGESEPEGPEAAVLALCALLALIELAIRQLRVRAVAGGAPW